MSTMINCHFCGANVSMTDMIQHHFIGQCVPAQDTQYAPGEWEAPSQAEQLPGSVSGAGDAGGAGYITIPSTHPSGIGNTAYTTLKTSKGGNYGMGGNVGHITEFELMADKKLKTTSDYINDLNKVGTEYMQKQYDITDSKTMQSQGIKHDADKPMVALVPASAVLEEAKVWTFGAKKYGAHNWRKGLTYLRILSALLRHTFAIVAGEDTDAESGLLHAAHIRCCAGMLIEFQLNKRTELDDRAQSVQGEGK